MHHRHKHLLIAAFILLSVSVARAELIIYDITNSTSHALSDLGTKFVFGCTMLAVGFVVAAVILRKK